MESVRPLSESLYGRRTPEAASAAQRFCSTAGKYSLLGLVILLTASLSLVIVARPAAANDTTASCVTQAPPEAPAAPAPTESSKMRSLVVQFTKQVLQVSLAPEFDPIKAADVMGWALKQALPPAPPNDISVIKQLISDVRGQIGTLQATVNNLCTQLNNVDAQLRQIATQLLWNNYQAKLNNILPVVSSTDTAERHLATILAAHQEPGTPLTDTEANDIKKIRDTIEDNMSSLNTFVNYSGGGTQSLLSMYAQLLDDATTNAGQVPATQSKIYTAKYLRSLYSQVDFYTGLMARNINLAAEAFHADYTQLPGGSTPSFISDPAKAHSLALQGQTWTGQWQTSASVVGQQIPDGTLVDARQSNMKMWTSEPVSLEEGHPARSYCLHQVTFCYDTVYTDDGRIGATELTGATGITVPDFGGLTQWRIPTVSEFSTLTAGATGGLDIWGKANGMDMFVTRSVTSQAAGMAVPSQIIGPYLAGSGVLHWMRPDSPSSNDKIANSLSYSSMTDTQNEAAGRLLMIREYVPPTPPTAATNPTATSASDHNGTEPGGLATTTLPGADKAGGTAGGDLAGATYSDPTACGSAATFTVPAGANFVEINAVGGAGGNGTVSQKTSNQPKTWAGGRGGLVSNVVAVTPGTVLYVQVAGNGSALGASLPGQAGTGGGGQGGRTTDVNSMLWNSSGGGGGASGVSTDPLCKQWLAVAGGGGGGGAGYLSNVLTGIQFLGGTGGDACASPTACVGGKDADLVPNLSGRGGFSPPSNNGGTGSNAHNGQAGNVLQGGQGAGGDRSVPIGAHDFHGGGGGGGGGAGFYGGGGGGGGGLDAGGGGGAGGSNFTINATGFASSGIAGVGQQPAVTIQPLATLAPTMGLTVSKDSYAYGEPITLTATMPMDAAGPISFFYHPTAATSEWLGNAQLVNGVAQLPNVNRTFGLGTYNITAYWDGDGRYDAADSPSRQVVVERKQIPDLTISVSQRSLTVGEPFSITAAMPSWVTGANAAFYDTDQPGSDHGLGWVPVVKGAGILTSPTKSFAVGTHRLSVYISNENYLDSWTDELTIDIVPESLDADPTPTPTPTATATAVTTPTPTTVTTPTEPTTTETTITTTGLPVAIDLNAIPPNQQLSAGFGGPLAWTGGGPLISLSLLGMALTGIGTLLWWRGRRFGRSASQI